MTNPDHTIATAAALFGAINNQPRGRVLKVRYAKKALPSDHPGSAPAAVSSGATFSAATGQDVLEVVFECPEGEETTHIPNSDYEPNNPTLHFLAAIGMQPSDIDGQQEHVEHKDAIVPLVYDNTRDQYAIRADVMERGKKALVDAEWNPWAEDDVAFAENRNDAKNGNESESDESDDADEDDDGDDDNSRHPAMNIEVK